MTKVTFTKPQYPCNDDFVTDFETGQGPGFFPGAGGYFHGCASCTCAPRIVFFGTDFGTMPDWENKVRGKGGEKPTQSTLRPLRTLVDDVGDETGVSDLACWCHLTNAVLALAKITDTVKGNRDTYKAYRKRGHGSYLRQCGEAHSQWLRERKPGLAVLLGAKHLSVYGCGVWAAVWPDLFGPGGQWCGIEMKDALSDPVTTAESGLRVLLMYHPSSGIHWWRQLDDAKAAFRQEVTRLADSAATRAPDR